MTNKPYTRYGQVSLGFDIYDYLIGRRSTALEIARHFNVHKKTVNRYLEVLSSKRSLYVVNTTEIERYNAYTAPIWGVLKGEK